MIWPCKIISKRLTAVFSDKDGTRIANLGHHGKCIFCHDFQMLRCDFVCRVDRVIQCLGDQNMPIVIQRFLNDLTSGELFYKSVHFPGYFFCQLFTGRHKNCRCQLIMFCLGQKIRCHVTWIGSLVCKNKDLTRSCDRINADMTVHCFLASAT